MCHYPYYPCLVLHIPHYTYTYVRKGYWESRGRNTCITPPPRQRVRDDKRSQVILIEITLRCRFKCFHLIIMVVIKTHFTGCTSPFLGNPCGYIAKHNN